MPNAAHHIVKITTRQGPRLLTKLGVKARACDAFGDWGHSVAEVHRECQRLLTTQR